jgi:hypothetical protein
MYEQDTAPVPHPRLVVVACGVLGLRLERQVSLPGAAALPFCRGPRLSGRRMHSVYLGHRREYVNHTHEGGHEGSRQLKPDPHDRSNFCSRCRHVYVEFSEAVDATVRVMSGQLASSSSPSGYLGYLGLRSCTCSAVQLSNCRQGPVEEGRETFPPCPTSESATRSRQTYC